MTKAHRNAGGAVARPSWGGWVKGGFGRYSRGIKGEVAAFPTVFLFLGGRTYTASESRVEVLQFRLGRYACGGCQRGGENS